MEIVYVGSHYDLDRWYVMSNAGKVVAQFLTRSEAEDYMKERGQ